MFKQLVRKEALPQSLASTLLVCLVIFFLAGCQSSYTVNGTTTPGNGHQGSPTSGGSGSTQTTGSGSTNSGSGSTTAPSQIVVTANEGEELVQQYYGDIDKGDFQDAYQLWGTDFQQKNSYNQFVAGFHLTVSVTLQVDSSQTSTDGNCSVGVTVTSRDQPSTGPTIFTTYEGSYIVGRQNGTDVLLTANLHQTQQTQQAPGS